jgi:ubiquinone/menaquinone biosynthesis C-methylase UbiE
MTREGESQARELKGNTSCLSYSTIRGRWKLARPTLRNLVPERIPWFAVRLYDRIAREAMDSYYRPVAREIVDAVDKGRFLDIGTGPGYLPIEIARIAPSVTIDAIDLTKRMIRIARSHAKSAGVSERIRFQTGDGNRLNFQDNTFDMVISTGSLHSWKDPLQVMGECHRVLKQGREAWIFDPAHISLGKTKVLIQGNLGIIDRLAFAWASWSAKAGEPLTLDQIRSIIEQLDFVEGHVDRHEWIRIKLKKLNPEKSILTQGCPSC